MNAAKVIGIWLAAAVLSLGITVTGMAQEEGEADFAFGTVVRIEGSKIVIKSYDFEQETEMETVFITNDETEYDGYNSLEEVKPGDDVDLEYVVTDGNKVVQYLYKSTGEEEAYDEGLS